MTGYLNNLRPSERRLVVVVAVVFFVVINFWFVIPHFKDWGLMKARMWEAQEKRRDYEAEIRMIPEYQKIVRQLEREGQSVLPEEQTMQFQRTIQTRQAESGVQITSTSKMQTRTNQFFLELSQQISLVAEEDQLVEFLYKLGESNSLIRVRELSLRPDQPRQKLTANTKLVASFQKKPVTKPAGTTPAGKSRTVAAASPPTSTANR